jgi:hypothetical protein
MRASSRLNTSRSLSEKAMDDALDCERRIVHGGAFDVSELHFDDAAHAMTLAATHRKWQPQP